MHENLKNLAHIDSIAHKMGFKIAHWQIGLDSAAAERGRLSQAFHYNHYTTLRDIIILR